MTSPETEWVLSEIKSNWSAGAYGDIPLERVDREDSEQLDGNIRDHEGELQTDNFVGAALASRPRDPIGSGFDYSVEAVVTVRVEGLHHTEFGYIDATASLPPTNAGDPVPFNDLVDEIQDTVQTTRTFPSVGRSDTDYTDVQIQKDNRR
jgi:hypothetical protein